MDSKDVDVVIIGAGLSGIGAACHLTTRNPTKRYMVLEARDTLGGTWDLFRYPGIRSDSDMHTLGYSFKPWGQQKAIADGQDILSYIRETAIEYRVDQHVRYGHKVETASWDSETARWNLIVLREGKQSLFVNCNFLYCCAGYYRYDGGHMPEFVGIENFHGKLIHAQKWPEDLDYSDKRVVVIGSGATAITIVPAMAEKAEHVTMLQRSPTYVVARPTIDKVAELLKRWAPEKIAYRLTRLKNILQQTFFYQLCRRYPDYVKRNLLHLARKQLGNDFDLDTHLTPRYNPWDQRLCLVPNGDLFNAVNSSKASIVTDGISKFTKTGIELESGHSLETDIVVCATGLELLAIGGITFNVDGQAVDVSKSVTYKGIMLSGLPNLAIAVGYTNASWTLKCDLNSEYVCRLLKYMDRHRYSYCEARRPQNDFPTLPIIDFSSGYILRAIDRFPRQGHRLPWRLYQNYFLDLVTLRFGFINNSSMKFVRVS